MCPITINKALLLQEGILRFELSWTAVVSFRKIEIHVFWTAVKIESDTRVQDRKMK